MLIDNLFPSVKTKLVNRLAPDAFRKRGRPRKLKSDKEP